MAEPSSVVLSTLEFDVLWEDERLPQRHVALDVPSPGTTDRERAELVERARSGLRDRGLLDGRHAVDDLADALQVLARPAWSVDVWVWTDHRISGLAAASGPAAALAVLDGDEVWVIPARAAALPEAAVSVAGDLPAGLGRSVSVPAEVLAAAERDAGGDARSLITRLESYEMPLHEAHALAGMLAGMSLRGQFGVQRRDGDGVLRRGRRVVGLHDTPDGRYAFLTLPGADGTPWSTVTPAGNDRLAACVRELAAET